METMGSPWQCNTGFPVGKNGIITKLQSAAGGKSGYLETKISFEVSDINVAYIPSDTLHSSLARKERCRC